MYDTFNSVSYVLLWNPRTLTHQKAFIFDQLVSCSVGIDSSTISDIRAHALGGARGQNLEHLRFVFYFVSFMESFVFSRRGAI